jgi:cation:H+ antiporter
MEPLLLLVASVAAVFLSSLLFVNAIEYASHMMKWPHSFTGAIVSPLFTSIPESIIFVVAVFVRRGVTGSEIGLGLIFGEPFMISSIAYFLIFVSMMVSALAAGRRLAGFAVDRTLRIPFFFVLLLFPLTLIPGIFDAVPVRYATGAFFLALYAVYVSSVRKQGSFEPSDVPDRPYFKMFGDSNGLVLLQLIVSAILLYYGAGLMVSAISGISTASGISALAVSILIIPVATAIPETLSAMIWAYRGKNSLAIGSVVGEKVLYATFYPGIAMFLVPWDLDIQVYISVLATTAVSAVMLAFMRKGKMSPYALLAGLPFFALFVFTIFTVL